MANKVDVDRLALEVIKSLDAYKDVTVEIVTAAVTRTAKETAAEIRTRAKEKFGGTGNYARSWKYKRDPSLKGKYRMDMVVYSQKPHYRLAHLLEKDHAKVNGGRFVGRPHISPAEQLAQKKLIEYIKNGIENGKAGSL